MRPRDLDGPSMETGSELRAKDMRILLDLGRRTAEARIDLARTDPSRFTASTVNDLERSTDPLARAAAVLVRAQRWPELFLKEAGDSLSDQSPVVRAAVIEGLATAALLTGLGLDDSTVAALLGVGERDSDSRVRLEAAECRAALSLDDAAGTEAPEVAPPHWSAVRLSFLEALLPDLGPSMSALVATLDEGKPLREAIDAGALATDVGGADPERLRLLRRLAPIAGWAARLALEKVDEPTDGATGRSAVDRDAMLQNALRAITQLLGGDQSVVEALGAAVRHAQSGTPLRDSPSGG